MNEEIAASKFASFKTALDTAWTDSVTSPSVIVIRQDRFITEQGSVTICTQYNNRRNNPVKIILVVRLVFDYQDLINLYGNDSAKSYPTFCSETVWRLWYKLMSRGNLVLWKDQQVPEMELSVKSPKDMEYTMSDAAVHKILPYAATFSFYLTQPALRSNEDMIQTSLLNTWRNSRTGIRRRHSSLVA